MERPPYKGQDRVRVPTGLPNQGDEMGIDYELTTTEPCPACPHGILVPDHMGEDGISVGLGEDAKVCIYVAASYLLGEP